MVKELSYATISCVLESWETARRTPNFEEVVGTMTLLKMFDYKPDTKAVFGFDVDYCPTPQELKDSGNLNIALSIIQKFDASLQMLGPDSELLEEILVDLGKRHARYGVKAVRSFHRCRFFILLESERKLMKIFSLFS
jgi:hypothetical protein